MDATLRLGLGNPLDAVCAALVLEDREGAVALDRVGALLDPPGLARRDLDLLPLETTVLGVFLEHVCEVGGPELALLPAFAAADLDDHVLAVGRVVLDEREHQLLFEPRHVGLVIGDHLRQLGVVARRVEVGASLLPRLRELPWALELFQAATDLGRFAVVVVDGWIGHPLARLQVGALELLDEFVQIRHRRLYANWRARRRA